MRSGLVDDQHLDISKGVDLLFEKIDQPTGGADQDIDPGAQGLALFVVVHPAVRRLDGKAAVLAQ
jgi:hypothetical protein